MRATGTAATRQSTCLAAGQGANQNAVAAMPLWQRFNGSECSHVCAATTSLLGRMLFRALHLASARYFICQITMPAPGSTAELCCCCIAFPPKSEASTQLQAHAAVVRRREALVGVVWLCLCDVCKRPSYELWAVTGHAAQLITVEKTQMRSVHSTRPTSQAVLTALCPV